MRAKFPLLWLLLIVASYMRAQAPQQINYQAVVRDGNGQPLTAGSKVNIRFSIHNGSPDGKVVFVEVDSPTTNQFGLITLAIGAKQAMDVIDWGGGSTFLQVEVDATGGNSFTDMGTTQLLSVPYALYAGRAGSVDNAGGNQKVAAAAPALTWNCTTHTLSYGTESVDIQNCNGTFGATGVTGATGATGGQGIQGTAGANGLVGKTGPTGTSGTNGLNGVKGATGTQGLQGLQGLKGATGATGAQGIQGIKGATGNNGVNGINGATGVTGSNGVKGATGANGAQGIQGIKGATGNNGVNGINGVTGATGNNGLVGATGPQGLQGVTGPQGWQGVAGVNGNNGNNGLNGATGITGPQGLQGITGPQGASGPQGLLGVAGVNGNNGNNGLNGATGATGPQGLQGVTGPEGAIGAQGLQGVAGVNGNNGLNGATGADGQNGTNGSEGAVGATGPAGQTGTIGATGTQGATGAVGATGPVGQNGSNGTNGVEGVTGATGPQGANGSDGAIGVTGSQGSAGATGPTGSVDVLTNVLTLANDTLTSMVNGVTSNALVFTPSGANIYNANGTLTGNRVVNMGTDTLTFNTSTGNFIFNTTGSGNMGVGTATPAQKLDVAGTTKTTGFQMPTGAASNYVFTSDSLGNASWSQSALGALTQGLAAGNTCVAPLGTLPLSSSPYSIVVGGNYAYVSLSSGQLNVYSLANQTSPMLVDSLMGVPAVTLAINGHYLYITTLQLNGGFQSGIQVYDISNPVSPNLVGTVTLPGQPNGLSFKGNYAYVIDNTNNNLLTYDISNPAGMALLNTVPTGTFPTGIVISCNAAYIVNAFSNTLTVFNLSSPAAPGLIATVDNLQQPNFVVASGHYIYAGSGYNINVYDITTPANPILVNTVASSIGLFTATVSANNLCIADDGSNFEAFNISNPATPVFLSVIHSGQEAYQVAIDSSCAYVINLGSGNMQVISLNCNAAPAMSLSVNPGTGALSAAIFVEQDPKVGNLTTRVVPRWGGTTLVDGSIYDYGLGNGVGVGTNNPQAMFDIQGNIRIGDGTQNFGYVLTSDWNGVASWQPATGGPQGPQGPAGPQGINGNDGVPGITGATGPSGNDGAVGATGAGIQGPTGPGGNDGATGPPGATGPQGPTGANGNDGAAGTTGANGNDGVAGATGATGPDGNDGAIGATGATGANGNDGATGANGNDGTIGATGLTGAQGPAGNNGATGPQGATGANGNNGTMGATGATGAQGPVGNNGATGAQGATGASGATGATGLLNNGSSAGNTPYWNGSQWVVNSSNIYNNGTNVGIGTTTPAQTLDVTGTTKTVGFQMPTGAGNGYILSSDSVGNGTWSKSAMGTFLSSLNSSACITLDGTAPIGFNSYNMTISDSLVYVVSESSEELRIYNIRNISGPTLVVAKTIGVQGTSIAVSGNYAYVLTLSNDLRVYNISNPANIAEVGSPIATGAFPTSIAISGNYAYVADDQSDDMRVYNISNPASITAVGSPVSTQNSHAYQVVVSGNYLYLVLEQNANEVMIFGISNPASPALVGTISLTGVPSSIAIAGSYAYITDEYNSALNIYNISNPASPVQVGSIGTGAGPTSVSVSGNYAWLVDPFSDDARIYDISNPASPIADGTFSFPYANGYPIVIIASGLNAFEIDFYNPTLSVLTCNCSTPSSVGVNVATGALVTVPALSGPVGATGPTGLLSSGSAAGNTPYWNGSEWVLNSSNIYNNGGNVGIGTTTPLNALQVEGNLHMDGNPIFFRAGGGSDQNDFVKWNSNADRLDLGGYNGVALGSTSMGGSDSISPVLVVNTGYVGIGTTTPTALLEVNGAIKIDGGSPGSGKVLTSDASGNATWQPVSPVNMYNTDGSLTGSRTVTMGASDLTFNATTGNLIYHPANSGSGQSVMLGYNTNASNNGVALGADAAATGGLSVAIGYEVAASGNGGVAIGENVTASGQNSTALGNFVSTNNFGGSFIYGDNSTAAVLKSSAANQFMVRASGGTVIYSNTGASQGVSLAAGGGAWATVSDRRKKENFVSLDVEQVLNKVAQIPVTEWNYLSQDASVRHIGPMAQDFYAAFKLAGLGNDTTITTSDIEGVSVAAIQGLEKRTKVLQQQNNEQIKVIEQQQKQLADLQKRLAALEKK